MRRYTRRVVRTARQRDIRHKLVGDVSVYIRARFDSLDEFLGGFSTYFLGWLSTFPERASAEACARIPDERNGGSFRRGVFFDVYLLYLNRNVEFVKDFLRGLSLSFDDMLRKPASVRDAFDASEFPAPWFDGRKGRRRDA